MLKENTKRYLRTLGGWVFGREPRVRRIPFEPLRGHYLCTIFENSPRAFLGIYDPWLVEITQKYIQPGQIVFDIGAQIGYTALLFALRLNNTGAVHAFEILPSTVQRFLEPTVRANRYHNIHIHTVGFYSEEKDFDLPVIVKGMTSISSARKNDAPTERCHVTTIDSFLEKQRLTAPHFCKMDVERAEISCLEGATRLLTMSPPIWVIEFHGIDLLRQGFALLSKFGYTLIDKNNTVLRAEDIERLEHFHDSVICLPPDS